MYYSNVKTLVIGFRSHVACAVRARPCRLTGQEDIATSPLLLTSAVVASLLSPSSHLITTVASTSPCPRAVMSFSRQLMVIWAGQSC